MLPPLASRLSLPSNDSGGGILPPLDVRRLPAFGDVGRDTRLAVIRCPEGRDCRACDLTTLDTGRPDALDSVRDCRPVELVRING